MLGAAAGDVSSVLAAEFGEDDSLLALGVAEDEDEGGLPPGPEPAGGLLGW
jgi:hypothetical protein